MDHQSTHDPKVKGLSPVKTGTGSNIYNSEKFNRMRRSETCINTRKNLLKLRIFFLAKFTFKGLEMFKTSHYLSSRVFFLTRDTVCLILHVFQLGVLYQGRLNVKGKAHCRRPPRQDRLFCKKNFSLKNA